MKRGTWFQFGDRSQKMVLEQLQNSNGVGVVISPRDLSFKNSIDYSKKYKDVGADVLIDLQFYNLKFQNDKIDSYPGNGFRVNISTLNQISENDFQLFYKDLLTINQQLGTTAVIAPAIPYELGRNDIIDLNSKLFNVAKNVGSELGIPTYATVILGKSIAESDNLIAQALSSATQLNSGGWYFGFEFSQKRIPSELEDIVKFGKALLILACSGKPVLHSFAGPMAILSMAFGATGTAIGHSQNLWQFTRGRWETSTSDGGGGNAPPRYFSENLWGTIVYPDEFMQLSTGLKQELISPSPWTQTINIQTAQVWSRWEANKHLLYVIGKAVESLSGESSSIICAQNVINKLNEAIDLGNLIQKEIELKDDTCCYQQNWKQSVENILNECQDDYDYLSMLYEE